MRVLIFGFIPWFFCSGFVQAGNRNSAWDVDVANKEIVFVNYHQTRRPIWDHTKNDALPNQSKRYYIWPLLIVQHAAITCFRNPLIESWIIRMPVLMWTDAYKEAAAQSLRKVVGFRVDTSQLELSLFRFTRLRWANIPDGREHNLPALSTDFTSALTVSGSVNYDMYAKDETQCHSMVEHMKTTPEYFESFLELEYTAVAGVTSVRSLTITPNLLFNTPIASKIATEVGTADEVYLRSTEASLLAKQAVRSLLNTEYSDETFVVSSDQQWAVADTVKLAIENGQKTFENGVTTSDWDMVFWDPEWARPDRVATAMNKVITVDVENTTRVFINTRAWTDNEFTNLKESFLRFFESSGTDDAKASGRYHIAIEDLQKWFRQKHTQNTWNGDKVSIKPTRLVRLSLSDLRQRSEIVSTTVLAKKITVTESIRLSFVGPVNDSSTHEGFVTVTQLNDVEQALRDVANEQSATLKQLAHQLNKTTLTCYKQRQNTSVNVSASDQDYDELNDRFNHLATRVEYLEDGKWESLSEPVLLATVLHNTTDVQMHSLSNLIQPTTRQIYLHVFILTGQESPNGDYTLTLWTQDSISWAKYLTPVSHFRYLSISINSVSNVLWLPVSGTDRNLYYKIDKIPNEHNLHPWTIHLIGYKQ